MVILVLSDLWVPFPGGAERLIFNLARHLYRAGEDVRVVTGYRAAQQFDGPPIVNTIAVPDNYNGEQTLARTIADLEPDVILTHHYWALAFESIMCAAKTPVVQVVLNGRRLRCAAFAVFISEYVATQEGIDDRVVDMTILPPAFDDVRANTHGDAIGFIKPLYHKGVDLVYDIARAMPDRRFVVLRGEWQHIETIVDLPNVEYMQPVVDMRDFYERVRLVLMPSISEDAGTVVQECVVNQIPCISSHVGGLVETNRSSCMVNTRETKHWALLTELLLDSPLHYAQAVQEQYWRVDQTELLDEFVARVRALAR